MKDNYSDIKWMLQDREPTLRKRQIYDGIYKGIFFEIHTWENEYKSEFLNPVNWTYYLFVNIDGQVKKEFHQGLWLSDNVSYYDDECILKNVEMHGGITYYEKQPLDRKGKRTIKFGCDYQHSFDTGQTYTVSGIFREVKESVDSFISLVGGEIKTFTRGDGIYRTAAECTNENKK